MDGGGELEAAAGTTAVGVLEGRPDNDAGSIGSRITLGVAEAIMGDTMVDSRRFAGVIDELGTFAVPF